MGKLERSNKLLAMLMIEQCLTVHLRLQYQEFLAPDP